MVVRVGGWGRQGGARNVVGDHKVLKEAVRWQGWQMAKRCSQTGRHMGVLGQRAKDMNCALKFDKAASALVDRISSVTLFRTTGFKLQAILFGGGSELSAPPSECLQLLAPVESFYREPGDSAPSTRQGHGMGEGDLVRWCVGLNT